MSPGILALIMIVLVLAAILTKKVPMNFALFVIPVVCGLLLGFSVIDLGGIILKQLGSIMQSAGFLLLFGNIYFFMVNESGMFDIIINKLISLFGKKMNVAIIMIMTTVIGMIGYLTANFSTVYLLCFPLMLPLYRKFKFNKGAAFIICQTACGAVGFLPWGIGVIYTAAASNLDPMELSKAAIPWGLCFIPVIVLQWFYFAYMHKKEYGSLGLTVSESGEAVAQHADEKPNARPKLFWLNLVIFLVAMLALTVLQYPGYLVFIMASIIMAMTNYPSNFGEIWNKTAIMFLNVIIMLSAISVYLAVFNAAPEGGISMINDLATIMVGVVPSFLLKYVHIIFLLLCVIIIRFVPFQVFNAMYPLFISIGASFGIPALYVIAPFLCNLALATSVTPFNSATYVGCNLLQIDDVDGFIKMGIPIMVVSNLVVVFVAWVTGVLVI